MGSRQQGFFLQLPIAHCPTAPLRPLPAWWLLQGDKTRSHPELGRQTPQRQWYFVSRHGRVGRRQACKARKVSDRLPVFGDRTLPLPITDYRQPITVAGWSSPVARQAHNLKAAGSNPAPATKSSPLDQGVRPCSNGLFHLCRADSNARGVPPREMTLWFRGVDGLNSLHAPNTSPPRPSQQNASEAHLASRPAPR